MKVCNEYIFNGLEEIKCNNILHCKGKCRTCYEAHRRGKINRPRYNIQYYPNKYNPYLILDIKL